MQRIAILTLCLFPSIALAQEDDRGFLTRMIEDNLSSETQKVRIDGFQGALSSRARMSSLTITDDSGPWLTMTDVVLDWSRSALLTGKLEVNSLTAAEIILDRIPAGDDSIDVPNPEVTPFALPELPVSVRIGQLSAASIKLGESILGEAITAKLEGGANLSGGEGNARIALERTDGKLGVIALEGGFVNSTRNLKIDLSLKEAPGGIAARTIGLPGQPALDLTVKGEAPLDNFVADVALRSDNQDRFAGKVRLASGENGARSFGVDLKGDVTPLFLPEYQTFFGPDVVLFAEGSQTATGETTLDALRVEAAALAIEGAAKIAADGLPQKLDLKINVLDPTGQPVLLPLGGDPVHVRSADLTLAYDAATGGDRWTLLGEIAGLASQALQADAFRLDGGGRIARGANGQQLVDGTLTFAGTTLTMTDPALAQAIGTEVTGNADFNWSAGGALNIPKLALEGAGYKANANLTLDAQAESGLAIIGDLTAQLADLSRFSSLAGRPLSGSGDVTWKGSVSPVTGAFDGVARVVGQDVKIDQPEADGLLRGTSTITLDATRGTDGITLRGLDVAAQSLALNAKGVVRATGPDLTATFNFADLGVLGGGRSGRFSADATLKGTSFDNDLYLTLKGRGQDIRAGIAQADGFLTGETRIDGAAHLIDKVLKISALEVNGTGWNAKASGALAETIRDIAAEFRVDSLRPAGAGFAGGLNGTLSYKMADGREVAALDATANGLAIGQTEADRILRGTTRLSTQASREAGVIRLEGLELTNPQLSANADATQANGQRQIDLDARLNDMSTLVAGIPGALTLQGRVEERDGNFHLNLDTKGPGGIDIRLGGSAKQDLSTVNLTVNGSSNAALANAFLGNSLAIRAPLSLDLQVNGPPALSSLSGRVTVNDGRLSLTNPPMAFSGLGGGVSFNGGRAQVDLRASADTGGGVSISGPVTLSAPYNGDLRVALDRLRLRDPQLYTTDLSGTISVSGPLTGGAMIAGSILVGETELRIPSTGLGGTSAIPDLRHIREPAPVRRTRSRAGLLDQAGAAGGGSGGGGPAFGLNVEISVPNRVFIRGRGLDAELGGAFRITGTTANVVPSGGLELVRGRLDLLGKRFDFTEGQLQMEGSLIPNIRLVATTDTVDGMASVVVDGPADAPTISFSSNPELPEEEVVARLLFGRGMTSLTPLQAAQLASAVASLTGRGDGGVVDRLRKNFGLDDFDVSASESGAAEVRAGKYISENAYVDLKVDSEGKSEVSLNLDVTDSVTVRGRAGADGAAGLGVHYERDY